MYGFKRLSTMAAGIFLGAAALVAIPGSAQA
jgi:hypothetical protein